MPERIEHDVREHRIAGRNSSGRFKKGESGNPGGVPGASVRSSQPTGKQGAMGGVFVQFEAEEGVDVLDSMERNATKFVNAAWRAMGNGNQRLTEIAFAQLLKDRSSPNPLAGLKDLFECSPEELGRLEVEINEGLPGAQ